MARQVMRHRLGRIDGSGTGGMTRPAIVCANLTGEQVSALADIAFITNQTIETAATSLLVAAIAKHPITAERARRT